MRIKSGGIKQLDRIWPLWRKLTKIHAEKSPYFQAHYENLTVEERRALFEEKSKTHELYVALAVDEDENCLGYCVASRSLTGHTGAVESIFVEADARGGQWGSKLLENAVDWLRGHGVKSITINVACGNEVVVPFYQKHGFYPKYILLQNME